MDAELIERLDLLEGNVSTIPDKIEEGTDRIADGIADAREDIANAIRSGFISPNVMDSNLEAANVVDVLERVAQAGFAIAKAINSLAEAEQ